LPTSDYLSRTSTEGHKVTAGVVSSSIGGVVILVQGLLIFLYGQSLAFATLETETQPTLPFGLDIQLLGLFGIIVGICILGGAYLISSDGLQIIGSVVVLIFSVVSIVVGGGWLVGLGFGILGGILALFRK
jgi:hypothetical protein